MGISIGPNPWWQQDLVSGYNEGDSLPDGSTIICKSGGTAWIVAPSCTQVSQTWNGTTSSVVGNKCCVCDWNTLNSRLISCGFNPTDWFVPSYTQLQNPGYVCRTNWDSFSAKCYWSSTEFIATCACVVCYGTGSVCYTNKAFALCVRAFRCVTY